MKIHTSLRQDDTSTRPISPASAENHSRYLLRNGKSNIRSSPLEPTRESEIISSSSIKTIASCLDIQSLLTRWETRSSHELRSDIPIIHEWPRIYTFTSNSGGMDTISRMMKCSGRVRGGMMIILFASSSSEDGIPASMMQLISLRNLRDSRIHHMKIQRAHDVGP